MKPESVRCAQLREDSAALSAMGRRGAKVTNEKRDLQHAVAEEYRQRRLDEAQAMAEGRGDELIPENDR
ncbi:MAG: hypothetical protein Q7S95_01190 [bacterium]|nr:hypothetical protein [bacterium]